HLQATPAQRRRLVVAAVAIGMVVAASVVFEFLSSSTWNDLAVRTLRVRTFQTEVLNIPTQSPTDIRQYIVIAGRKVSRPGSMLLDPLQTGSYLLVPFALCVERLTRRRATSRWYIGAACMGVGLILTYVRSAVLGSIIIVLIA